MNTTLAPTRSVSIGWLIGWTIASALGFAIGLRGSLSLLWSVGENSEQIVPSGIAQLFAALLFGLGIGLLTGLAQWLVLRQRGETSLRWVGATVIGSVLGGTLVLIFSTAFGNDDSPSPAVFIAFAGFGAILGAIQLLMERRVAKSALWILASAIGVALGGGVPFALGETLDWALPLGALAYGALTAVVLWWTARSQENSALGHGKHQD